MDICLKRMMYLCFIATFTQHSSVASSVEETANQVEESTITLAQESGVFGLSVRGPNFINPAYPIYSNIDEIYIPNASVANFSSDGIIGATIRCAQSKNDIPNPNKYTHSAFLFHANPMILTQKISDLMHREGTELFKNPRYGAEMIRNIEKYYPETAGRDSSLPGNCVFCAESDGSVQEVLNGIYPHVHIHPFKQTIETYGGEVSFRPCMADVSPARSLDVVLKYVGTPYESPATLDRMVKAINGKNKVSDSTRLFCSEFVALSYKDLGLLPAGLIPDNVIPEQLSAGAEEHDLLKEFCGQDTKLKNRHRKLFCGCCW